MSSYMRAGLAGINQILQNMIFKTNTALLENQCILESMMKHNTIQLPARHLTAAALSLTGQHGNTLTISGEYCS